MFEYNGYIKLLIKINANDYFIFNVYQMLNVALNYFMQRKNINCSISESLQRFEAVCEAARKNNIAVRG